MQSFVLLTSFLLVTSICSAAPSVSSAGSTSNQQSEQQASSTNSVSQPQVVNSPVQPPVVEAPQPVNVEQAPPHPGHQFQSVASYYAPSGLITVVGADQQNKPVGPQVGPVSGGPVRNFEQYGQPESAAMPPNYKPFGSWGLYIGGNPADGYYTNYYKALGNSVDKQQTGAETQKPGVAGSQTAAFSPVLRQAGSSPYGGDYYPFAYSPSDLNSAMGRVAVESPVPVHQGSHHSAGPVMSPVQAGAQVYGSPVSFESNYGVSPYADAYATKKVGAAYAQKEVQVPSSPASKGYQSRVYVYPPVGQMSAPVQSTPVSGQQQQVHQPHVVAYPVPVSSQIVGSQPGVEGAFNPYGVHAFTRYAVKPTVVNSESERYYGYQMPAYKQQVYSAPQAPGAGYYPMSFYGYPVNQLHYSHGSVVPSMHGEVSHHNQMQPGQGDTVADKSDNDEKFVNKPQQKKA